MSFYWIKTNRLIKWIFPTYIWNIPSQTNQIYLTFDDGPIPQITDWVLTELEKHNAKATFFCIGKNIEAHPHIFGNIVNGGHAIGNHTYNHLNGWKTTTTDYLQNIEQCKKVIEKYIKSSTNHSKTQYFRPPYGKIKSSQAKELEKLGYKIIMWDVLSADFDQSISKEKCLKNVISNIEAGSIIVFHDSAKAFKNLKYTLPKVLAYLDQNHFTYETLR